MEITHAQRMCRHRKKTVEANAGRESITQVSANRGANYQPDATFAYQSGDSIVPWIETIN